MLLIYLTQQTKLIASINLTRFNGASIVWPHAMKTSSSFRSNTKQTRFGESSRFDTANYTVIKEIFGSLPDMVTFFT
jgi:hypothetical protein